jgi:hypothetical protein
MTNAGGLFRRYILIVAATPQSFWLSLIILVIGVLWFQFLPPDLVSYLNAEEGPFEQFSVAFLAGAAVLSMAAWVQSRCTGWLAGCVVLVYAVLRELDFQKMFTYRSVMSLGYFSRPVASLPEKAVVLLAVAPCLIAIAYLLNRAMISIRKGFCGSPGGMNVRAMSFWIVILFALSHLSDRTDWFRLASHVEAFVEAILALMVLLLVAELKPRLVPS